MIKYSKNDLRYVRLKEAFDALKLYYVRDLINKIALNYIDFLPDNNHLFEGTIELLDLFKRQNTNCILLLTDLRKFSIKKTKLFRFTTLF